MHPETAAIQNLLDRLPDRLRQRARDYLTEDRLRRRMRIGMHLYAAELRGYEDVHHPSIRAVRGEWRYHCSCGRRQMPCPHVAALLVDLTTPKIRYPEAPWALAVEHHAAVADWLTEQPFPWQAVPEDIPPWRLPFSESAFRRTVPLLERSDPRAPLAQDGAAALWAEADDTWIQEPSVLERYYAWLEPRLERPLRDLAPWVTLQWMQPDLPMARVWMSAAATASTPLEPMLRRLFEGQALHEPTDGRIRSLLAAITVIAPHGASSLWDAFRAVDPHHLFEADALYLRGYQAEAVALLERELPEPPEPRRLARERLVRWLPPKESLPHRLALAWDTGSTTILDPVRSLISDSEWSDIIRALSERSPSEP
ncbi:MAG: hypothetical protein M1272_08270 [Firmicutes bacterium]|nr:hypothetical protein [Bacillota bacterium]